HLRLLGRIQLRIGESCRAEKDEKRDATDNPAHSPARRLGAAFFLAIDLQRFQFRLHGAHMPRSALRISFLEALCAGNNPPNAPKIIANATPYAMIRGVTWKLKSISLKLAPPTPVVMPLRGSTS